MPLPALHLRLVQAIVKIVNAPDLSLRGRFAPVAISRTNFRIRRSCPVIHPGPARLPRRFAPRNDTSRGVRRERCTASIWLSLCRFADGPGCPRPYRASTDLTAVGTNRQCLPEIATGAKRPRNDTSGSAKVHQRPCTVELPRTGRSGSAAAAEPSKYPGMHPRKCGKAVAVGGFTKRSKKTSVWVLTKLRLGGIVSLALRGMEC